MLTAALIVIAYLVGRVHQWHRSCKFNAGLMQNARLFWRAEGFNECQRKHEAQQAWARAGRTVGADGAEMNTDQFFSFLACIFGIAALACGAAFLWAVFNLLGECIGIAVEVVQRWRRR